MLRLAPFDKIGQNPVPDCVNADPVNGVQGSILNMLMFNILQHEGENVALLTGLTPSGTDLTQWAQAIARGGIWVGTLTGTGDLAVATLPVVLPALLQGMRVGAVAANANTTTTPKLRLMNYGSQNLQQDFPILKQDGTALAVGDIKAGRIYRYEADGAGNVLISGGGIGTGSSSGGSGAFSGALFTATRSGTGGQALQNNTETPLQWTAPAAGAVAGIGTFDGTTVTFNVACRILISAQMPVGIQAGSSGSYGEAEIYLAKNGQSLRGGQDQTTRGGSPINLNPNVIQVLDMAVGDTLQCRGIVISPNFASANTYDASSNGAAGCVFQILRLS